MENNFKHMTLPALLNLQKDLEQEIKIRGFTPEERLELLTKKAPYEAIYAIRERLGLDTIQSKAVLDTWRRIEEVSSTRIKAE
jgi:hypothetical protein